MINNILKENSLSEVDWKAVKGPPSPIPAITPDLLVVTWLEALVTKGNLHLTLGPQIEDKTCAETFEDVLDLLSDGSCECLSSCG